MSTSKHTFDQVKSILGKLDRSIDDARAKRLDGDRPETPASAGSGAAPLPGGATPPSRAEPGPAQSTWSSPPSQASHSPTPPRPLRATPNYGGQSTVATNGRAERKGL